MRKPSTISRTCTPLIIIFFLLLSGYSLGGTFTSVKDGLWGSDETWGNTNGIIPGAGDDVIINHQVSIVQVNAGYCYNLTINPGGSLVGAHIYPGDAVIVAGGNFTNNGNCYASSSMFRIYVGGNLAQNTTLDISELYMDNAGATQTISLGPGSIIECPIYTVSSSFPIIALTDLHLFSNYTFDLNGRTLEMNTGMDIFLDDASISDGTITTSSKGDLDFHSSNNGELWVCTVDVDNANIYGELGVNGTCTFNGNVNVYGYLQPLGYETLNIYGNLWVAALGEVRDDPNAGENLTIMLEGDLYNYGAISNYEIVFAGDQQQTYSFNAASTFTSEKLSAVNSTYPVVGATDLAMVGTIVNFDYRELHLMNGINLSMDGDYMYKTDLVGIANNTVTFANDVYIEQVNITNVEVAGICEISGDLNTLEDVTISGTIQPKNYTRTITFKGFLINNGTLRNHPTSGSMIIDILGNMENNGEWSNYSVYMKGTTLQDLSMTMAFSGEYFYSENSTAGVRATSDLLFNDVYVDFNTYELDMNGYRLYLDDGRLYTCYMPSYVKAPVEISGSNTAYIESVIAGDIVFYDEVFIYAGCEFNDVTIEGALIKYSNYGVEAEILGNITNNGEILNNASGSLTLNIHGDIDNQGIWQAYYTDLEGSNDQTIICGPNSWFEGYSFRNNKSGGNIVAGSDIRLDDITADFNYGAFDFSGGYDLYISDGYFSEVNLIGATAKAMSSLVMTNGAYLQYADVTSFDLKEKVELSTSCTMTDIVVTDTLKNRHSVSVTSEFYGTLENNGVITQSGNSFIMKVYGDIINNGECNNSYLRFAGTDNQNISCLNNMPFSNTYIASEKTAGNVVAISDLYFSGIQADVSSQVIDLSGGYVLHLDGGRIYTANIIGSTGSEADAGIFGENEAYLYNVIANNTLKITGTVNLYGNTTLDNIIVEGILQNRAGISVTNYITGNITNSGTIQDNPGGGTLGLYIEGDITNNGSWSNVKIYLDGTADQHIGCLNNNTFELDELINNNSVGDIIANGHLSFTNTNINFGSYNLDLTGGYDLALNGGRIYRGNINGSGNESLTFTNAAYFYESSASDVQLDGVFMIYSTQCDLHNITNNGTLQARDNGSATLDCTGEFVNNDQVINSPVSGNLTINMDGNVVNNGIWTNYLTYFNGNSDQQIIIIDNQEIQGEVRFVSEVQVSPYQWYFDGAILDSPDFTGETYHTLTWQVPVSQSWYGTFHCDANGVQSRNITVGTGSSGLLVDVKTFLEGTFNGTNMETVLNGSGYLPLAQPYSASPWNYTGSETVTALPSADIADWVLLELRDAADAGSANGSTVVARRAAFILSNGVIVDLDGISPVQFAVSINQNMFAVVYHRNHLAAMSANPLSQAGNVYVYDFTASSAQFYGNTLGSNELAPGVWGMIAGDGDASGQVNNQDKVDVWAIQAGLSGYNAGDFSMDGQVNNADKVDLWVPNGGRSTQVPN